MFDDFWRVDPIQCLLWNPKCVILFNSNQNPINLLWLYSRDPGYVHIYTTYVPPDTVWLSFRERKVSGKLFAWSLKTSWSYCVQFVYIYACSVRSSASCWVPVTGETQTAQSLRMIRIHVHDIYSVIIRCIIILFGRRRKRIRKYREVPCRWCFIGTIEKKKTQCTQLDLNTKNLTVP